MRQHKPTYADGRQVWEDSNGYVITNPLWGNGFNFSADDSLEALEEAARLNDEDVSIEELMHRDVPRTGNGPRGRRRSRQPKPTAYREGAARGRPQIGDEKRVRVHTSVARMTLEILRAKKITLAAVFDAYVEMIVAHGG